MKFRIPYKAGNSWLAEWLLLSEGVTEISSFLIDKDALMTLMGIKPLTFPILPQNMCGVAW